MQTAIVNPDTGNDETADGTWAKPFKTIQGVLDKDNGETAQFTEIFVASSGQRETYLTPCPHCHQPHLAERKPELGDYAVVEPEQIELPDGSKEVFAVFDL